MKELILSGILSLSPADLPNKNTINMEHIQNYKQHAGAMLTKTRHIGYALLQRVPYRLPTVLSHKQFNMNLNGILPRSLNGKLHGLHTLKGLGEKKIVFLFKITI